MDYVGDAGKRYHAAKHSCSDVAYDMIADERRRRFALPTRGGDRVLEYGVGPGWNLHKLADDISKYGYDLVNVLRSPHVQFVSTLDHNKDAYDVVLMSHMLEHVIDPFAMVVSAGKLLGSEGRLVVIVPFERAQREVRLRVQDADGHLYSWTPRTITNLLIKAGYRIERTNVRRCGYDLFVAKWTEKFFGQRAIGKYAYRSALWIARLLLPVYEIAVTARIP